MGLEWKAAVAAALTALAGAAHAGCKDLAAAIEASQKEIADQVARMPGDKGGEAARRARIAAELEATGINVTLLDRAKCPTLAEPVSAEGAPYLRAASRCAAPGGDAQSCDRSLWKRE